MEPALPSPEPPRTGAHAAAARRQSASLPWVLLLSAVVVGGLLAAFRQRPADSDGRQQGAAAEAAAAIHPSPRPTGETVSLAIDFGNGVRKELAALAYRHGMTVGDLMRAARKFQPGIQFTQRGAGAMGFLESLENVENEGGKGRNWLYSVDGNPATQSFDVQRLDAGAAVLWEFRGGE